MILTACINNIISTSRTKRAIMMKYLLSFIVIFSILSCNFVEIEAPVLSGAEEITFVTTGSSFSPVITVSGSPEIQWIWADGTESNSTTPTKNYGSAGTRANRLRINPWSSVIRINIGYDSGDGGSSTIEYVADQNVASIQGLDAVAPYLQQWCSSYNKITSLNFSNFTKLDTIECYFSQSLEEVILTNTPALQRACFEDCNLLSLDLSQSPKLKDLRGALNAYTTINFGSIGSEIWHICIRNNSQLTKRNLFADMSQFPVVEELFIWNDNQAGSLNLASTGSTGNVAVYAYDNYYTSANFSGAFQNSSFQGTIYMANNQLTSLNITGCSQLTYLDARTNNLGSTEIDSILYNLDTLGRSGGTVDLTGNSAPSTDGQAYIASLVLKGWTVTVDE